MVDFEQHAIRTLAKHPGGAAPPPVNPADAQFVWSVVEHLVRAGRVPVLADLTNVLLIGDIVALAPGGAVDVVELYGPSFGPAGQPGHSVPLSGPSKRLQQRDRLRSSSALEEVVGQPVARRLVATAGSVEQLGLPSIRQQEIRQPVGGCAVTRVSTVAEIGEASGLGVQASQLHS